MKVALGEDNVWRWQNLVAVVVTVVRGGEAWLRRFGGLPDKFGVSWVGVADSGINKNLGEKAEQSICQKSTASIRWLQKKQMLAKARLREHGDCLLQ